MSILLLGMVWLLVDAAATQPSAISTQSMCEELTRQYDAMDGMRLRFNLESHYAKGAPVPPDERELGPRTFTQRHAIESTRVADQYRVDDDFEFRTVDDGVEKFTKAKHITTWNGVECRVFRFNLDNPEAGTLDIAAAPDPNPFAQYFMTWQGWWLVQASERMSFLDVIRKDPDGPEAMPDGRTRWQISGWPISKAQEIIVIARRFGESVELDEVQFRVFRDHNAKTGSDADLLCNTVFNFGPVRRDRHQPVAAWCTVRLSYWMGEGKDFWGFARMELTEAVPAQKDATTFRQPPTPMCTIIDERYKIAYEQDSHFITVDGRLLKTDKPVRGDGVGHELEKWVERGEWVKEVDPVTGEPLKPQATTQPDVKNNPASSPADKKP